MKYSLDMICIIGADGKFVQVSEASKKILGYDKEELIGTSYLELVFSEDLEKTIAVAQNILNGAPTNDFENRYVHKSGKIVTMLWSAYWSAEDETTFCIARDATQLIQAQKKEKEKEAFYEALVEYGSDMVGVLDENGNYIFVGSGISRIMGYPKEDLIGANVLDHIHPNDLTSVQAKLAELLQGDRVAASEFRHRAANGEWKWLETVGSNQLHNPAVRGIVVNSRDITARKQEQLLLQQKEQLYRCLFSNNPDAILLEDVNGVVLDVNEAQLKTSDLPASEMVNQHFTSFLPDCVVDTCNQHFQQALSGRVVQFDLEVPFPTGESKIYDISKFPVVVEEEVVAVYSIAKDITPIARAYDTIQRQSARQRIILESITDAFFALDKNGCFTYTNSEFERLIQVKGEEVKGKSFWSYFSKSVMGQHFRQLCASVKTGEAVRYELFHEPLKVWLDVKAYPSEEGLSVYLSDITKQKQIEEQEALGKKVLELNAAPGSTLEELINSYLVGLEQQQPDMLTSVLYLENNRLFNLASPSLPKAYLDAIHGVQIGPKVGSCGTAAFLKEKVIVSDLEVDPLWAEYKDAALQAGLRSCWSLPIIGSNQKVLGTFAVYHQEAREPSTEEFEVIDKAKNLLQLIIENKMTEAALKLSNERYNLATSATSEAIYDFDVVHHTIHWGEGFETMFGFSRADLSNTSESWIDNIHPDDQARVVASFERALLNPEVNNWQEDYRFFSADGQIIQISDRARILRNKKLKPIRVIGSMQDISARKQYEIERENLIEELQGRNNSLQQFTHIVSHNLRAPVANILGLTDMFKSPNLDEQIKLAVNEKMRVAAQNLDTVIRDLNQILSIRGSIGGIKEQLVFTEKVEEVLEPMHLELTRHQVNIQTDFKAAPSVFTVGSYLYSILYNLITNAIKYRKPGQETEIHISTRTEGDYVVLTVKDYGLGFDVEKQKKKLFGLYNRFHSHIEGRGVGLFLVKAQAEALGGKVTVQSKVQEGTTFEVYFKQ
ncbi:PAS domain S-box protein [Rufibacter roseus]|uniref:histidine kinase n=2 Tax=Rufibacter roseus TaxID=1567108 RepID=A0ABW2DKB4_9BACT|nr:PAS domain S-box protein [Rufibacter roseus]